MRSQRNLPQLHIFLRLSLSFWRSINFLRQMNLFIILNCWLEQFSFAIFFLCVNAVETLYLSFNYRGGGGIAASSKGKASKEFIGYLVLSLTFVKTQFCTCIRLKFADSCQSTKACWRFWPYVTCPGFSSCTRSTPQSPSSGSA